VSAVRNLAEGIKSEVDRLHRARFVRAVVTGNDTNQVFIRRTGFAAADEQSYPTLDATLLATDEVVAVDLTGSGGWVVLGKILRNP
jgi:hypothetical protein